MLYTVEEIVKKFSHVGMSGSLVKMLQRSLYPGEEPGYAYNGPVRKGDSRMEGIVLVTTRRVLCCTREYIAKELTEIPIMDIRGMQIRKGKEWIQRELHIESLNETIIVIAPMNVIRQMQVAIQTAIDYRTGKIQNTASEEEEEEEIVVNISTEGQDMDKELRTLKKLYDDGIITQEEFDAKKKQVLGL